MRESCPWFMPQDEARSMIQLIEAKICTSEIEVRHRDALVRLRSVLEEQIGIEPRRCSSNRTACCCGCLAGAFSPDSLNALHAAF
jgi:hypothetical protein